MVPTLELDDILSIKSPSMSAHYEHESKKCRCNGMAYLENGSCLSRNLTSMLCLCTTCFFPAPKRNRLLVGEFLSARFRVEIFVPESKHCQRMILKAFLSTC